MTAKLADHLAYPPRAMKAERAPDFVWGADNIGRVITHVFAGLFSGLDTMRKRKVRTKKIRIPVQPLRREIQFLRDEVNLMRQMLSILIEKHDRQHASAIAVNMENARLRMNQEKEPPPPSVQLKDKPTLEEEIAKP